jgi:hypothetical protein
MSVRENIANNLVTTLKGAISPIRVKYVTREPFDFDKLSNAQFPAILVRTANEDREEATLGGTLSQRMGAIDYQLVCFVKSKQIDTARNQIIEAVEESLDVDRSRGGYAIDTQITSIETDDGSIEPVGGVIITVNILYTFTRGNA